MLPISAYSKDTYMTLSELNEFRKSLGLRPIVRGKVTCLHCGKEFTSRDKDRHRICKNCKACDHNLGFRDEGYSLSTNTKMAHVSTSDIL